MVRPGRELGQDDAALAGIRRAVGAHVPTRWPGMGRASAVLVPLLPRPEGLHVLFTERSRELRNHAGQVSFPGGRIEPQDETFVETALREAREEVGLDPAHVEVLGSLDDCPTTTGYVITPVVGVLDSRAFTAAGRYPWAPSAAEIAALHELPLAAFQEPANLRIEKREYGGKLYDVHWYTVGGAVIWGATARILHDLLKLSFPEVSL